MWIVVIGYPFSYNKESLWSPRPSSRNGHSGVESLGLDPHVSDQGEFLLILCAQCTTAHLHA